MLKDKLSIGPCQSYYVNLYKKLDNYQKKEYIPVIEIIVNQLHKMVKATKITSSVNSGLNSKFSRMNYNSSSI